MHIWVFCCCFLFVLFSFCFLVSSLMLAMQPRVSSLYVSTEAHSADCVSKKQYCSEKSDEIIPRGELQTKCPTVEC